MSKGTKVQLGGKERYLRFDANALADVGDVLGIEIRLAHIGEDLLEVPLPLSALRTVVWGALLHAEPELTEREVGGWVHDENWAEVFQAFFSRFNATSPETQATVRRAFGQDATETSADEVPKPRTATSAG